MADSGVDRLLTSLDAMFDAAIARQEDEAASDLARSLQQDLSLADTLPRMGPLTALLSRERSLEISVVGRDYVAGGSPTTLIPMRRAVLIVAGTSRPEVADNDLLAVLRGMARAGHAVTVRPEGAEVVGRLRRAGADHILIEDASGRHVVVGSDAVRAITVFSDDRADVR